jgi:hypothetical protein
MAKVTKAALEEGRRRLMYGVTRGVTLRENLPESYFKVLKEVWQAWDRKGHAGAPEGEDPEDFLVTSQRGKGRGTLESAPMLWYKGLDGLWRDCSWASPKKKSPVDRLKEAARDSVQVQLDNFSAKNGGRSGEDVDHAEVPFCDLLQNWLGSLTPSEVNRLLASASSRSGVSLREALQQGHQGAGGATGKSTFGEAVAELRKAWEDYHAAHAVLQMLPSSENRRLGARPHPLKSPQADAYEFLFSLD